MVMRILQDSTTYKILKQDQTSKFLEELKTLLQEGRTKTLITEE